ncbi:hypothetical protein CRG98_047162, partial [Punica granatum]
MALGDLMASRFSQSSLVAFGSNHIDRYDAFASSSNSNEDSDLVPHRRDSEVASNSYANGGAHATTSMAYLPQNAVLCDLRHEAFEACVPCGPSDSGLVSKWRPKDRAACSLNIENTGNELLIVIFLQYVNPRKKFWGIGYSYFTFLNEIDGCTIEDFAMKTGCVAIVLCLNISVDPPDVIKISPCARMECWIDPFSMAPRKAIETIGEALKRQYERWQPKACYKDKLDPTVDEVKKLCTACRKYAKSERVLFHYNGHGVPKPTANGEIWVFNKSYTQYIPLPISDLDSWLKTPSIYVFDCSAAGLIVNAFSELHDLGSSSSVGSARDCILLAACEAHETLPQSAEFPADIFTSCLTTPIKMALRWFCARSLLRESLDYSLIDKIPGRPNDRKTLLGELNWIFTAVTDTIAWNVLPH